MVFLRAKATQISSIICSEPTRADVQDTRVRAAVREGQHVSCDLEKVPKAVVVLHGFRICVVEPNHEEMIGKEGDNEDGNKDQDKFRNLRS